MNLLIFYNAIGIFLSMISGCFVALALVQVCLNNDIYAFINISMAFFLAFVSLRMILKKRSGYGR